MLLSEGSRLDKFPGMQQITEIETLNDVQEITELETMNDANFVGRSKFCKILLDVGDGVLNDDDNNFIIPDHCLAIWDLDIVDDIYGNLLREKSSWELAYSSILSARNLDVEEINKRIVEFFDKTTEIIYTSVDTIWNCDNEDITEGLLPEYLNIPYWIRLYLHMNYVNELRCNINQKS